MARLSIEGKVVFEKLEGGLWGIIDANGTKYFPVNLPEQLKFAGHTVRIVAKTLEDMAGISMWGTPVKVVSFETVHP